MTHTYATLGLSKEAYGEIAGKLMLAGYYHCFMGPQEQDGHVYEDIDLTGIAIRQEYEHDGSRTDC